MFWLTVLWTPFKKYIHFKQMFPSLIQCNSFYNFLSHFYPYTLCSLINKRQAVKLFEGSGCRKDAIKQISTSDKTEKSEGKKSVAYRAIAIGFSDSVYRALDELLAQLREPFDPIYDRSHRLHFLFH
jgi:hypothetical protein